jgi:AraC-like DNA-binding protein
MHVAVAALKEEGATVGQLADRLGYRSEAAFSRAFKRVIGVSPGAVRRTAGERALIAPAPAVPFVREALHRVALYRGT